MKEWYLNPETMSLDRLCNSEHEHAKMACYVGLSTAQGAYLYHEPDFGINYTTIYEDSKALAKLKLLDSIRNTLKDWNITDIDFVRTSSEVRVSVSISTDDYDSLNVQTTVKF